MTNPDTPTLRQTERDLYAAADELREEQLPTAREKKEEIEQEMRANYAGPDEVPADLRQQFERAKQVIKELAGTADTFEHYADEWTADGDDCTFTLEELNGDEFAAVRDAVDAERRRNSDGLPEGYGMVKALEYGTVEKPPGAPADPGLWPAAIVQELFGQLQEITAPSGVDLGNESVADVFGEDSATAMPTAGGHGPDMEMPETAPGDG